MGVFSVDDEFVSNLDLDVDSGDESSDIYFLLERSSSEEDVFEYNSEFSDLLSKNILSVWTCVYFLEFVVNIVFDFIERNFGVKKGFYRDYRFLFIFFCFDLRNFI